MGSDPAAKTSSPLDLVRFRSLQRVPHAISTRRGGVSPAPFDSLNLGLSTGDAQAHVHENRRRLFREVLPEQARVRVARLRHAADVSVFKHDAANRAIDVDETDWFSSDGFVSDAPNLFALLTFADCVPLAFYDPRRGVVGAAHAGWRGTALGIGPAVVGTMRVEFGTDPEDVVVGVGPSIGPCCYTIGTAVISRFRELEREPVLSRRGSERTLDLWATNELQLRKVGVREAAIENPRLCTGCRRDTFFSHRADHGNTGRFGLLIGAPGSA